jgi:hypothetical protein
MTYDDSREKASGSTTIGSMKPVSMFTHAVGEPYMDALAIFKSPIRLASFQWTTGTAEGTQFLRYKLPEAFLLNETFHKLMLQTYTFYKADIKITIQINATPQHMGLLCLWYDPFNQYADTSFTPTTYTGKPGPKTPNVFTVSGQPHAYLQACDSDPIDLPIRYEHPQSCLTTNSIDPITNMGTFGVMVINALECPPTSSSSVTVQMWMSFENVEVGIPIWNHTPAIPAIQQSEDREVVDLRTPDDYVEVGAMKDEDSYGPPRQAKQTAWWEKGLGFLAGVGGAVWNGFTGNWGGAVRNGVEAVKSLLMDKPPDPLRAVNNMLFPVPPLAHTQGVAGYVRLDAAPMGGYTNIDFSSSDPIEQKMMTIMKTPMMCYRFNWSESDAPGTQLFRLPVTPSVCNYQQVGGDYRLISGTVAETPGTYILRNPTYLSKVSSLFRFWKGSIKYHFQFITTSLHTGKVMCTFIPNNYTSPGTQTLPQQTCASSEVFDVAGQKNFDFSPKWASAEPRKSWYDWATVDYSALDDRTIYGWIEMKVVGQLTTTNAIPGTVHCNVFISAGEDFFCESLFHNPFSFPAGYPVQTDVGTPAPSRAIQQSDEDPEYKSGTDAEPLNNMCSTLPSQMTNQAIGDIRDPCRRANYLGVFSVPMKQLFTGVGTGTGLWRGTLNFHNNPVYTDGASNLETAVPMGSGLVAPLWVSPNPQQNLMAYVSDLFVFYSGGIDFTFIPFSSNSSVHLKAYYYPLLNDDIDRVPRQLLSNGSYGSLASHMTVLNQQRALQVTAPFTSNYNQLALLNDVGTVYDEEVYSSGVVTLEVTASTNEGFVQISEEPGQDPVFFVEVYKTLADDGRFSWLVSPGMEWTLKTPMPPA